MSYTTDIWSLSVSLFQLVSNNLPFDCSSPIQASISIAGDMKCRAPDVRDMMPEDLRSTISASFAEVLSKGLEKYLKDRFQTMDSMATALHGCLVQNGEAMYSAFISYRVKSEKFHSTLLYEVLNNTTTPSGHRVIVYLDVKRLVKGEDWEEGFSLGLLNSLVALPLVSSGVIGPMVKFLRGEEDDRPDNVLKELIIMQALLGKAGKMEAIYPILVGNQVNSGEENYPRSKDFFIDNMSELGQLLRKPSPATTDAVIKFLEKNHIDVPDKVRNMGVKQTADAILALQGAKLWAYDKLVAEDIDPDSPLARKLQTDPPDPPLDFKQLCMLKAELHRLVPDIHEVIDRALVRLKIEFSLLTFWKTI